MFYLSAFIKSIYDINWLRSQKHNGKQSATYIILLILILSSAFSFFALNRVQNIVAEFRSDFIEQLPDFEVSVENGEMSVSGVELPFSYEFRDEDYDLLLYVDTTTSSIDIADIASEDSNVLLFTKEEMIIYDGETQSQQVQDFDEIPEEATLTSISKVNILEWIDSFMNRDMTIFMVILVVIFVLLGIGKLIYLLILTLIVNIIQKIAKKQYRYGELFTMGLFAITGPSIIVMVLRVFDMSVPYLYTILVLAYLLVAVFWKGSELSESSSAKVSEDKGESGQSEVEKMKK